MKVYIVEHGYYGDRIMSAIFSTQEKAVLFIEHNDFVDPYVIEQDVDEHEIINPGYYTYSGRMLYNGESSIAKIQTTMTKAINMGKMKSGELFIRFVVDAKSEEHALKIVNEKRIMAVVQGKWVDGEDLSV
jgi:hypothetical protein